MYVGCGEWALDTTNPRTPLIVVFVILLYVFLSSAFSLVSVITPRELEIFFALFPSCPDDIISNIPLPSAQENNWDLAFDSRLRY